jgi:hypothetical protein
MTTLIGEGVRLVLRVAEQNQILIENPGRSRPPST